MRRLLDAIGLARQARESGDRIIAHRYRVIESLGTCGAGERLIAEDEASEQQVLLLVLGPAFAGREAAVRRYVEQPRDYGDPRIVLPHAWGVDGDRPFTVTRWIDGEPLTQLIGRGLPPWSETFELLEDLADILSVPHQQRLAHGSLEPGRIFLSHGTAWILDFGLAAALGRSPASPAYVAPEILAGRSPNHLSDLYSLAVIIWELVSGAPPFTGSLGEIVDGHRNRPVPELVRRSNAPPELEVFLDIALAKLPDERFANTLELLETLRGIQASSSGVWSLSALSAADSTPGEPVLPPTTELGAMLRSFSVIELRATRDLIDQLLAARGG